MNETLIQEAASHFGKRQATITPLNDGLIHHTYKVEFENGEKIVLQKINRVTFPNPENIIYNYLLLSGHLGKSGKTHIPPLIAADTGEWFWKDGSDNFWRATAYENNSSILPFPKSPQDAF